MERTSAKAVRAAFTFARRLGIALPANLVLFWFVLRDNTFEVVLFGVMGGVVGALLIARLEQVPHRDTERRSEDAGLLARHAGHA